MVAKRVVLKGVEITISFEGFLIILDDVVI